MSKKQDWLDIIEKASELKKGTKIPKDMDAYSLTMLMYPSPNRNNGTMPQFGTGAGADGVVQPEKPVALDTSTTPPSIYHEGETVRPFPGGKEIIPAETEEEQRNLGVTQRGMRLPGYQTGGTVYEDPYSLDRRVSTRPTSTLTPTPQQQSFQRGTEQAYRTTQQRAAGTDPLMQNITGRALQDYDIRAAVGDTATRQALASKPYLTEGAKRAVTAKQQATYRGGLSQLTGDLSAQAMQRGEEATRQLYEMGRTGVQDEQARQQWEKTFGEQQYQTDIARKQWEQGFQLEKQKYGDQEFARMADDAQTTSLETWLQQYPNATAADYNTAREYKSLQLESMGIGVQTASENLRQLQDSARWNEAQQFLNAGDFENYRALVKEITGRDINTDQFQQDRNYLNRRREQEIVSGDINIDAQRLGLSITQMQAVINDINSGVDIDNINAQYGTTLTRQDAAAIGARYRQTLRMGELQIDAGEIANEAAALGVSADRLSAFINAVNKGADLAAANQASGLNLTRNQFYGIQEKYQQQISAGYQALEAGGLANDAARLGISGNRLNTFIDAVNRGAGLEEANAASGLNLTQEQFDTISRKYRQGVEAADMDLMRLRNKVGDELYDSVQDMINKGATLKMINDRARDYGIGEITQEEFQSMYDASALGERNWGRELTAVNMLLASPGTENKYAAQDKLNEIFPGVGFDFEDLANEEKYETFADGLALMASYVAADLTYEEAFGLMQAGGVADKMGVDASKLGNLYNAMQVNAIDSQWEEMENSDFYKGLEVDEQIDLQEFFKQNMLGMLDYTTMHEYEIYNPDGSLNMTVYGKDSSDADKKAAALGADYTVKDTGKVKFQMTSTLISEGGSHAGETTTRPVGEIYTEDDRVYKVGAGQKIEEIKVDPEIDAWTDTGNDVIAAGKEGNPYYNDIISARAQSIIDGTHEIDNKIDNMDLLSELSKTANEFNPTLPEGSIFKRYGKVYKTTGNVEKHTLTDGRLQHVVSLIDLATGKEHRMWKVGDDSGIN